MKLCEDLLASFVCAVHGFDGQFLVVAETGYTRVDVTGGQKGDTGYVERDLSIYIYIYIYISIYIYTRTYVARSKA